MKRIDLIEGMRIAVLGMARSGMAIAQLLRKYGAHVIVSDIMPESELTTQIEVLRTLEIEFETGGHSSRAIEGADFVVVSPGIAPDTPFIKKIEHHQLPIFSEIEVASWLCEAAIIAITASNGKSTTTALTAHLLNGEQHKAVATGNIGSPFAADVDQLSADDFAIVEVSSFQLERTDTFKPKVSAILNITPDHLDRYESFEKYAEMKFRIADEQDENDLIVLNHDDPLCREANLWGKPEKVFFSTRERVSNGVFLDRGSLTCNMKSAAGTIVAADEIGIPGPHNLANAAAAAAMALAVGAPVEQIAAGLRSFTGIPHRLEFVAEFNDIRFVNDSKATNVDSVYWALQSQDRPMILIMGGRDKGSDFSAIRELVSSHVKLLCLVGEAAPLIEEALGESAESVRVETIPDAVRTAYSMASPGDLVLLSPGCTSFDQFRDFEQRGDVFKDTVFKLRNGNG